MLGASRQAVGYHRVETAGASVRRRAPPAPECMPYGGVPGSPPRTREGRAKSHLLESGPLQYFLASSFSRLCHLRMISSVGVVIFRSSFELRPVALSYRQLFGCNPESG